MRSRPVAKAGAPAAAKRRSAGKLGSSTTTKRRRRAPVEKQYVGIDLHRRRSVIVRKDPAGTALETAQIDNSALALAEVVARAGESPEVVLEATYGWYWAADVLAEMGASTHPGAPARQQLGQPEGETTSATPLTW